PKTLATEQLLIKGPDGRTRISLVGNPGVAGMNFYDRRGKIRGSIAVADDGYTSLAIRGPDEKEHILLGDRPDGVTGLAVFNAKGEGRIRLEIGPDGNASLGFLRNERQAGLRLGIAEDGVVSETFGDREGKPRLMLNLNRKGEPRFMLADAK